MRIMRGVAAIGIAKKVYDEARKPRNQARIRAAVEKVRSRSSKGSGGAQGR